MEFRGTVFQAPRWATAVRFLEEDPGLRVQSFGVSKPLISDPQFTNLGDEVIRCDTYQHLCFSS